MNESVLLLIGYLSVNCEGFFWNFYCFHLKEICINDKLLIQLNILNEVVTIFTHYFNIKHLGFAHPILIQGVRTRGIKKYIAYVLVPKSFMKFMFSTVYRVTQKNFYASPYTSMWAPVVARQISKRYSSSCHVFISMWGVVSLNIV
jgi:hypothetical protein